jgi:hypothetical protein
MHDLEDFTKKAFNFFVKEVNQAFKDTQKMLKDLGKGHL